MTHGASARRCAASATHGSARREVTICALERALLLSGRRRTAPLLIYTEARRELEHRGHVIEPCAARRHNRGVQLAEPSADADVVRGTPDQSRRICRLDQRAGCRLGVWLHAPMVRRAGWGLKGDEKIRGLVSRRRPLHRLLQAIHEAHASVEVSRGLGGSRRELRRHLEGLDGHLERKSRQKAVRDIPPCPSL